MAAVETTVFVCVSCRRRVREGDDDAAFDRPGVELAPRLATRFGDDASIVVTTVDCLAVCKRPCTVALVANEKWTYLVGDLDPLAHVDDIENAVRAYAASDNGIVAWKDRPATFRRGVVARIPPVSPPSREAAE